MCHVRSGGGVHEVPSSVAHVQWDAGRGGQVHQQQLYPCKLTRVGHIVVCMHAEDASVVFASHNRAEGLTVLACGHTSPHVSVVSSRSMNSMGSNDMVAEAAVESATQLAASKRAAPMAKLRVPATLHGRSHAWRKCQRVHC